MSVVSLHLYEDIIDVSYACACELMGHAAGNHYLGGGGGGYFHSSLSFSPSHSNCFQWLGAGKYGFV